MRYLKYLVVVLAVIAFPAVHSQAQVSIGIHIGPDYGYYHPEPVCVYGYYPYYPFTCAPYGYWGPQWFAEGVFIGAGPWDHFYYVHPEFHRAYWRFRDERFHHERFEHFREVRGFRGDDRGFREFRGGRDFRRFHDRDGGFRGGERRFRSGEFRGERFHEGRGRGRRDR